MAAFIFQETSPFICIFTSKKFSAVLFTFMILYCSVCLKEFVSVRAVLGHLKIHEDHSFDCGLCGCTIKSLSFPQLRSHLYNRHCQIYSEDYIPSDFFVLSDSFITMSRSSLNNLPEPTSNADEILQNAISLDDNFNFFDTSYEAEIKNFLTLLVKNGFKKNASFQMLSSLGTEFIKFFCNESNSQLCCHLKDILKSQESLDFYLEKYLEAVYPEAIDIRNSHDFFAYIPLEKTLRKYLNSFLKIDHFLFNGSKKNILCSFFDSSLCNLKDTIFLNIFVDDFQISNPLLSKKALHQEFTGIYFRVLTSSRINFSKKTNIHLLTICKSSFFKN